MKAVVVERPGIFEVRDVPKADPPIQKEHDPMARPAIHPGEILAEELATLGVSAAEAGRALHVPTNRITQILNGQRAISADTALRIGFWLGTGPELWLNLQKAYELRLTEATNGEEIRRTIQPVETSNVA